MSAADRPAADQGRFVTGSLMRHVVTMSLSGTLGLSFTFLVDFLALWWISQLRDEAMIAAVGIAATIQFAAMSIAIGMMIGAVALVSRAIGMGERARARRIATVGIVLMVAVQAFNGAGDTMTPTWINLVFFWLIQIPLSWALALPLGWAATGVFWGVFISETAVGVFTLWLFSRGRWKTVRV